MIPLLALTLLPQPLASHCTPAGERVYDCRHEGRAFTLVLPMRPAAPAILLLHGAGRNHRTLLENEQTRSALLASRSVIVMPDGGNSWWLDTAPLVALMDWIEKPLGIRQWSATGWSMGAYGSVRLVQEHSPRFRAWAGMIGLLDFPNPEYPKEWNHSVPAVLGSEESWPAKNPMAKTEALRGKRLWFGTADQAFERKMNEAFAERLRQQGIAHQFEMVPGGHTFAVVTKLLPEALRFLDGW